MNDFAVVAPLAGGALIGLAASGMLFFNGQIAGVSGLLGTSLRRAAADRARGLMFLIGLAVGGALLRVLWPAAFSFRAGGSILTIAGAGLLVGYGTRLGNGCTSGHGVCGLSRLSLRSLAATMTFMATGALAVFVVNHLFRSER